MEKQSSNLKWLRHQLVVQQRKCWTHFFGFNLFKNKLICKPNVFITPRPSTVNRSSTPAFSTHGPHSVPTIGPLVFPEPRNHCLLTRQSPPDLSSEVLLVYIFWLIYKSIKYFNPYFVLWPHTHAITNHFPIGHPSFHSGVLSGCAPEKVSQLWWHR